MLFHYNGHGVPRPTANGEVWVFNKSYTQYIPLSIYDLQVHWRYGTAWVVVAQQGMQIYQQMNENPLRCGVARYSLCAWWKGCCCMRQAECCLIAWLDCVQTWVGTPAIYVFDCSAAGQVLYSFRVSAKSCLLLRCAWLWWQLWHADCGGACASLCTSHAGKHTGHVRLGDRAMLFVWNETV